MRSGSPAERPARRDTVRGALGAVLVALLGGCSDEPGVPWTRLARGAVAPTHTERVFELPGGAEVRLVERDGEPWLATTITRADWSYRRRVQGGAWVAQPSLAGTGRSGVGKWEQRLVAGDTSFRATPPNPLQGTWNLEPDGFWAHPSGVHLKLAPGAEPPESCTLEVYARRHRVTADGLRVNGRQFGGDGFAPWPGETVEVAVDVEPDQVLRFATAVEPLVVSKQARTPPTVFRVTLDGEVVFEHAADSTAATMKRHTVLLPPGTIGATGAKDARLAFTVEGGPCYASFVAPVIGPRDPGGYGTRAGTLSAMERTGARAPDVIVFLADTFRADLMTAYGSRAGVTPNLDRVGEESLVFTDARSVSTWTLPAHVTMFSGLYPLQLGVVGKGRRLPESWRTLAEHLRDAGYRTGAVTESVMVSQVFGLDQGFEWWDESSRDLGRTLARASAFLEADDGRPVFLFVHTYRTHAPFHVDAETRRTRGAELGIRGSWDELHARLVTALADGGADADTLGTLVDQVRAHYVGGAAALDRGFGTFVAELSERGLDDAWLFVTSDHGEAFLEHDVLYHPGAVWDELLRVPLLVRGPGLAPGRVDAPASLIDLAPTVAALAGLDAPRDWPGRSLLGDLPSDRPLFAFECQPHERATLGIVRDGDKWITLQDAGALARGELLGVYDLARDPGETNDLADGSEAEAATTVFEGLAEHAATLLEPLVRTEAAHLDAAKRAELEAMGYTGGDEE